MWVRFIKDFDYAPAARNGHVTIAYKAGSEVNVTRDCADKALAAKAAERLKVSKTDGQG